MEIRQNGRFDPESLIYGYFELVNDVTGEFLNREEFLVKNISMSGVNFMSNYPPLINNSYQVLIHYGGEKHLFSVQIIHSRILRFQREPEGIFRSGVVYATGCQFLFENEFQKNLIAGIIRNECAVPLSHDSHPTVVALAAAL